MAILWTLAQRLTMIVVLLLLLSAGGLLLARLQHRAVYAVQSGSMEPAFGKGDAVVISNKVNNLQSGDIVSFYSEQAGGVLITHRVIAVNAGRGQIITKGDSADSFDKPVGLSDVAGKVEYSLPLVGYGLDFLRQPLGLALAVYLPAGVIMTSEMRKLSRHYASRRYRLYGYVVR